jgi:hypothetical protein
MTLIRKAGVYSYQPYYLIDSFDKLSLRSRYIAAFLYKGIIARGLHTL